MTVEDSGPSPKAMEVGRARLFSPTLLVVDGDAASRARAAAIAVGQRYFVKDASNADEAMRVAGISVVMTELELSGPIDGLDLGAAHQVAVA